MQTIIFLAVSTAVQHIKTAVVVYDDINNSPCFFQTKLAHWILPLELTAMAFFGAHFQETTQMLCDFFFPA